LDAIVIKKKQMLSDMTTRFVILMKNRFTLGNLMDKKKPIRHGMIVNNKLAMILKNGMLNWARSDKDLPIVINQNGIITL
jgi:hypothetical protein